MALFEARFDSELLHLSLGAHILLPEHPAAWREPPAVLYLLHGLSDDHTIWCRRTSIERYAAAYNLAVVMPDAYKSFYCDMEHGSDYLRFTAEELPQLVSRWFRVSSDPQHTFVAGLSMGGYGAMKLAMFQPERYAAAASLSGALDLAAHIDEEWDRVRVRSFEAALGDLAAIPGSPNDLIAQLNKTPPPSSLPLYLCCGRNDPFYTDTLTFRDAAEAAGCRVTFEDTAGDHDWAYWDSQIQRVLAWLPIQPLDD